jgi:hypothetical protein
MAPVADRMELAMNAADRRIDARRIRATRTYCTSLAQNGRAPAAATNASGGAAVRPAPMAAPSPRPRF